MGNAVWVQCAQCGKLHRVKSKEALISDDDLYTKPIFCPKCRDGTKHLWCGENQEDIYMHYDVNLDPKYY
jgi:hypothetical protein